MPTCAPGWQKYPTPLGGQTLCTSFSEAFPRAGGCATQVRDFTQHPRPGVRAQTAQAATICTVLRNLHKRQLQKRKPGLSTSAHRGERPKSRGSSHEDEGPPVSVCQRPSSCPATAGAKWGAAFAQAAATGNEYMFGFEPLAMPGSATVRDPTPRARGPPPRGGPARPRAAGLVLQPNLHA